MSDRELTGYDNHDANSGEADEEVFLYHARKTSRQNRRLVCASCDPTGAGPVGILDEGPAHSEGVGVHCWAIASSTKPELGEVVGWLRTSRDGHRRSGSWTAFYQSRYLSDSGRLFFNSSDALVPQDVNGTEDVYEYEPLWEWGAVRQASVHVQRAVRGGVSR